MFNIYNNKHRRTFTLVVCIVLIAAMVLTTVLAVLA